MKEKILILDPERKVNYKISKDTSGGYGTGNDFGNSIVPRILKNLLKKYSNWPPLFAGYTFSVLEDLGHEVTYSKNLNIDFDNFDIFIIVSSIVCCETELETIKKLKSQNKKIFAIGPFATNMFNLYTNAGATVIMGEPEFFFLKNPNLEKSFEKEQIIFNNNFKLDDLPFPKWDLMIKNMKNTNKLFGNHISIPILATRGCPYSCSRYCVYPLQQGSKIRQRNPKNIIDEMEYWNKNHDVSMFIFRDPVFSINRKHTIEFCNELINRNLNVKFVIETHLSILNEELISLLKKAGLKGAKVGIESSDIDVLKQESRHTVNKDEQLKKIRELEKSNIMVSAMFIIGFPSDTHKSIENTIEYAKLLNTTYAQFSVWTPYPGTPVFGDYQKKIIVKGYENFDQYKLVYKHKIFNQIEIKKYLNNAYSKYYTRFAWFYKYIKGYFFT